MNKIYLLLVINLFLVSCQKEEITNNPASENQIPSSLPTNETLYYSSKSTPSGAWQIYKKKLSTNTIDAITNDSSYNYWWVTASPDNKQLLLLRSPITSPSDQFDYANCEMIKCNADGSDQEVIITDNQYNWFAFGNPHWHPNGDRILMIAQTANTTAPFYTYTVDVNGNNPELLINQYSIDANWNRTGDKITFIGIDIAGFLDATSFEVFTANYNHSSNSVSSIQQLTADTTRNHDPCFSPDGTHIAFSASNANLTNADLITIETNGTNRTNVLNDNGIHGGPLNWGNDGKIYNHSIYIGTTGFTVNAFNTTTNSQETLLASPSFDYISPYYSSF